MPIIYTRTVSSLTVTCAEFVVNNMALLISQMGLIESLPGRLKDKILKKFLVSQHFWRNVDFKTVLKSLVHSETFSLNLTLFPVDDDVLNTLQVCTNLRELYLTQGTYSSVTTQGLLKLIPYLPNLYLIRLSRCSAVDDSAISCLAEHCPKLAGLDVHSCINVTSKSISKLANSDQLLWLTLSKTNVCDFGVKSLAAGPSGKNLKELRLNDCSQLTRNILPILTENCSNLEILVFNDCTRLEGDVYLSCEDMYLKHLKQIEWTIQW